MLVFDSQDEFNHVYEKLREESNRYFSENPRDTAETSEDLLILKPILQDFDAAFPGFISLRSKIENDTRTLRENGTFGINNDPDDFFVPDDYFRTLINDKLEVKIGSSIYKIIDINTTVEITDSNLETLEMLRQNIEQGFLQPAVIIHNHDDPYPNHKGQVAECRYDDVDFTYSINGNTIVINFPSRQTTTCAFLLDFGDGSPKVSISNQISVTHTYQ